MRLKGRWPQCILYRTIMTNRLNKKNLLHIEFTHHGIYPSWYRCARKLISFRIPGGRRSQLFLDTIFVQGMDTHCATDNEHPLFLSSYPLYDLVGTLSEGVPGGLGTSDTVQLEERRYPC